MEVHIEKRKLRDGLLEPVNPHIAVLAAFLNLFYGIWVILPNATDPAAAAPYLSYIFPGEAWGVPMVLLGIAMLLAFRYWNVESISNFMAINGVMWAVFAALMFFGDWHSAIWIQFGVVAVYSIFISANMKVNFVPIHRAAIKNKKFVQ